MSNCKNCGDPTHTPDFRTGLIHTNNRYVCRKQKDGRVTVAE